MRPGQKVLNQAGAGGVGTSAIQLAKLRGASVATTVSASKTGAVKSLGADVVVDYQKHAFGTVLHDSDVVLDTITGPPDPTFAKEAGVNPVVRLATAALSYRIRRNRGLRGELDESHR